MTLRPLVLKNIENIEVIIHIPTSEKGPYIVQKTQTELIEL